MTARRFPRRAALAGLGGLLAWAVTGCNALPGAKAGANTEAWLRSRPWVTSYVNLRTEGWGPVPLPNAMRVSVRVHAAPGTDRRALAAIAEEIEEFVREQSRHIRGLQLDLDFDTGRLPLGHDPAENAAHLATLDRVTDPRAQRIELVRGHDGLRLMVTTRSEEVLAYATWLTGQALTATPPTMVTVRDFEDTARIDTALGHTDDVREVNEMVSQAKSLATVNGFRADTTKSPGVLHLHLAHRDDLDDVFRTLRTRWPEAALDLTVLADRLGVRGSIPVLERLGAATALVGAADFTQLVIQDVEEVVVGPVHLSAQVADKNAIAGAASAIGAHPGATGDGRASLALDPNARLRLNGSPIDVADCGGPAQAVMTGPGARPSVAGRDRNLRLSPDVEVSGFPAMARAIRAAGWKDTLTLTVDQGLFAVSYVSTATGRAQDVTVRRSVGTVDGAAEWIRAWDATATE